MADSNRLHSINTSRILRTIWLNPGISRIKVAEMLDLDRSTVTKIMQVILDKGLVETAGKNTEQSGVGRRQINLRIRQELGVVLGLEVQATRYMVVVTTLSGSILHSFEGLLSANNLNLVSHVFELVARAKEFIAQEGLFLLGIGIGLPGIHDLYTGTIIRSHSLGVKDPFNLKKQLEKEIQEPIFIENDANCCCWGEIAFGTGNPSRNFITVLGEFRTDWPGNENSRGLAIGTGIVIRERVLHGDHFTAGEFRTAYTTRESGQFLILPEELALLPENTEVLDRVYKELSINLAFLINCLDLTKVLIAGDLSEYTGNFEKHLNEAVHENWSYDIKRNICVEFSDYGTKSVCIGAAGLFVEKLFSVPDVADRFQELVGYDLYEHILKQKG